MKNNIYAGFDLGTKSSAICFIDNERKVIKEVSIETEESEIIKAFAGFENVICVVESAPMAEWLCNIVEKAGHKISIIDARHAKIITHSKKKTDKLDARKLAEICRTGWFNTVHRKSGSSREIRSYMTGRNQLVKVATTTSSSIRGILRAHGIKLKKDDDNKTFDSQVRRALVEAPAILKRVILPLLKVWKEAHQAENLLYRKINDVTKNRPEVKLLTSIPAIGPATAAVFAATIDNPERFSSAEKVASYIGLVPKVHQSGDTEYTGRITKDGDKLLRWLLVEAAHVLLTRQQGSHRIKEWGLKLAEKKGHAKAQVAVARKLSGYLYSVWKSGQPFSELASAT